MSILSPPRAVNWAGAFTYIISSGPHELHGIKGGEIFVVFLSKTGTEI